jgi:type III pantothenate kinase
MGTATTIEVLDERGCYIGGTIIPGTNASLDSLVAKASQLPAIPLEAPKRVIGRNTVDCMQSGIVYGQACMLDGMLDRFVEELGYDCKVVATGGLSGAIIPHCRRDIIIDPMLMLKGLKLIYDRNRETDSQHGREASRNRNRHSEG